MEARRLSPKSRNGCQSCKKRHIKCDEQRPTCANCLTRDIECRYPIPKKTARSEAAAQAAAFQITFAVSKPDRVADMWLKARERRLRGSGHPISIAVSPLAFSSSGSRNRALELELMNRWSTRAWKLLYAIPECKQSILVYYTRDSLSYTCMTKQMLAAAALEIALYGGGMNASRDYYTRAALEYMEEAHADCQEQMKDVNKDNLWLLSEYLAVQAMLNFALPRIAHKPGDTVLDRTVGFWESAGAALDICGENWEWLFNSHSTAKVIQERYPIDMTLLDTMPRVKEATKTMCHLSRLARVPPTGNPELDDDNGGGPYASAVPAYRLVSGQTRYAFGEDRIKNYLLTVCIVAHTHGPEFIQGLRCREPIALFTLMFWGVLLNAQSYDEMIWWVRSSGRELVREVSEVIAMSHIGHLEDVQKGIRWCREQVDLEPLNFSAAFMFDDASIKALGNAATGADCHTSWMSSHEYYPSP